MSGDNKVPSSVMCSTATAYMQLETSDTQHDENLKPDKWMWKELVEEQRKDLLVRYSL